LRQVMAGEHAKVDSGRPLVPAHGGITAARIGGSPAAEKDLEAVLENAQRVGFVDLELEAGLALGELELTNRDRGPGRTHLLSLVREARTGGSV